jgi:hypothetical protein
MMDFNIKIKKPPEFFRRRPTTILLKYIKYLIFLSFKISCYVSSAFIFGLPPTLNLANNIGGNF